MLYIQTAVVNNPKFIEMQHMTLKRFVKDDYKFVVYNDAKYWEDYSNHNDTSIKKEIIRTCERLNIECINIPNDHHVQKTSAGDRCADACNYILKDQLKNNEKALMLDSDMFIVDDINICNKYSEYEMAIVPQVREKKLRTSDNNVIDVHYYWNGVAFFDMPWVKNKHLLNWDALGGRCAATDVGGEMYRHIHETPHSKTYSIPHLMTGHWNRTHFPDHLNPVLMNYLENDPKNFDGNYFAEIYDGYIFHYRAGGNWEKLNKEVHQMRTNLLWDTLVSIVKG
jgi:hypothetical protein